MNYSSNKIAYRKNSSSIDSSSSDTSDSDLELAALAEEVSLGKRKAREVK